jgi:hypothetical protein
MKKKDLILSYATYANYSDLNVFFRSARRFCRPEEVDIVVIINPMGNSYAELSDRYEVQLIPAYSIWREVRTSTQAKLLYRVVLRLAEWYARHPAIFGNPEVLRAIHRTISHPWIYAQAQRFLSFEDFLRVRSTYNMILLTDARDVVFQQNPFSGLSPKKLHVALQNPTEIYGSDNVDSRWMREVIGRECLEKLRGKIASCCGTTIGGYAVVMEYLEKLTSTILEKKYRAVEQPMHNEIVYLKFPSDAIVLHDNLEGPFITLGGMSADQLELSDTELRVRGRLVPVVHMYDRIPETKALFGGLYAE